MVVTKSYLYIHQGYPIFFCQTSISCTHQIVDLVAAHEMR